jgi:hypothetical protein
MSRHLRALVAVELSAESLLRSRPPITADNQAGFAWASPAQGRRN